MKRLVAWHLPAARGDLVALAVFVLCALLLHKDELFAGRLYAESDTVGYYYPILADFREELRGGRFPLWSPDIFTGFPLYADGESGLFYPPNLVAMVLLSPVAALVALRLAHTLAAALFAYTYLRLVGVGSLGALVGGLVYAFGSFLVAQMHHANVLSSALWLPATLLFVELWWRRAGLVRRLAWLGATASLAMTALGVHVQVLLMVGGAYALYVLFRLLFVPRSAERRNGDRLRAAGALLLAAPAVAAALAAVQILPFLELAGSALRGQGASYEYAVSYSLPPLNLLNLLFPYFFRNAGGYWWSLWAPWETTVYLGIAPLFLALLAVLFVRRRLVVFYGALGLLALFVAMGDYLPIKLYALIWQVPGLSGLRAPGRYTLLFVFSGAVLAALGTAWLALQMAKATARRQVARFVAVAAVPAVALAILVFLGSRYVRDAPEATLAALDSLYMPRPKSPFQLDLRAGEVLQGLQDALSLVRWETSLALGLLALAPALLALWVRFPQRDRVWQACLVALVAGDLMLFGWNYHPLVEAADLASPSLLGGFLQSRRGLHRVEVTFDDRGVGGNRLLPLDVSRVGGYSSLRYRRAAEYRALMPRFDVLRDLAGVRYVVLPGRPEARKAYADTAFDLDTPLAVLGRQHRGAGARFRLPGVKADGLRLIAYLENAVSVPQGEKVAELVLRGESGETHAVPLRAGQEVYEWAYNREDVQAAVAHQKTVSALSVPATDHLGRRYRGEIAFAEVDLPQSMTVVALEPRYVGTQGRLSILGIGLLKRQEGTVFSLAREHLSRYRPVFQTTAARVLENGESLPRAFLVPEGRWVEPSRRALSLMVDEPFDPRTTVLLEGDEGADAAAAAQRIASSRPAGAAMPASAEVRVEQYEPARVSIAVKAPVGGFLVLTDAYYPGWRALVDGVERPILLANYLYRAVALEAGDHQVEFVYEPMSLRWGLGLTAAALLVVGLVAAGALRQRRRT